MQARAILNSASSASFISERLARSLHLLFTRHATSITGIAGLTCGSTTHSVTIFSVSAVSSLSNQITVTAVVIPKVTCDLSVNPVPCDSSWKHIKGIQLADPEFGKPGRVDILLGVDVFVNVLQHGRRIGPPGSPVALQTKFGWVLAGNTDLPVTSNLAIVTHLTSVMTGDELIKKFWELGRGSNE